MPAKAGKFVLRAGDITVPPSNSGFAVTGLGFEPDIVIVMTVGLTAENSWVVTPPIHGGMSIRDKSGARSGLTEMWDTDIKPDSGWSNTGIIWLKSDHSGSGGPAFYIADITPDGFSIGYASGFEGGYGVVCYYLAIQTEANTSRQFVYPGAATPMTLGWEPSAYFVLGSGGLGSGADDIFFTNFSVPSWAFGGYDNQAGAGDNTQWLANGLTAITSVEQVRFIDDGGADQVVFDGYTASQIVGNSIFLYGRTPTEFTYGIMDGFPQGLNIRASVHLMEEILYGGGAITPNPVGTPLAVDPGFSPDAVIFLGPQDHHVNATLGAVPWGGRCFGFLTDNFQCCIAWGAYSHIGTVAAFCTSDFSWISNFTSTQLDDPTNPNYGTAEIIGPGFTLHTQAAPKFNKYLRYAAYGVDIEGPQFFRVL